MNKLINAEKLHAYLWILSYTLFGITMQFLEKKYALGNEAHLQSLLHWIVLLVLLFVFYPWLWYVRYLSKKASWKPATIISTVFLFPFTGWLFMNIILTIFGFMP